MGIFDISWSDVKDVAKDIFTPKNILEGIGAYGKISAASDANRAAIDLSNQNFAHDQALSDQTFQQQIQLAQLRASLAGGGGSATPMVDMRPYIYQGKLKAAEAQMVGRQDASTLTVSALKNLIEAAQRPLTR